MSEAINFGLQTIVNLWNMCAGNFLLAIPIVMMISYILIDVITRLKHISRQKGVKFRVTEPVTGIAAVIAAVTQILTGLTGWLSSLTTWILGDNLAIMFYAIMFIMLALHVLYSLINGVK